MKSKFVAVMLAAMIASTAMSGCGNKKTTLQSVPETPAAATTVEAVTATTEEAASAETAKPAEKTMENKNKEAAPALTTTQKSAKAEDQGAKKQKAEAPAEEKQQDNAREAGSSRKEQETKKESKAEDKKNIEDKKSESSSSKGKDNSGSSSNKEDKGTSFGNQKKPDNSGSSSNKDNKSDNAKKSKPSKKAEEPAKKTEESSKPKEPEKPAHTHTWVNMTKTVHHDEKSHTEKKQVGTETVVDKEAWDEDIYETKAVSVCKECGYTTSSTTDMEDHLVDKHDGDAYSVEKRIKERVNTEHHDAVTHEVPIYEDVKVVDEEAWDETVVTGQKCSGCGATK